MTSIPAKHLSESLDRIESIDALRGLAALSVLLFHAHGDFWVGLTGAFHRYGTHFSWNGLFGYLTEPFSYGWLGVDLFFILSGYCIHRRGAVALAENRQARLKLGIFAWRRFWRIYPTYTAALLLTALIDVWLARYDPSYLAGCDTSLFSFLASLLTLQGYVAPYFGDNAVFWTLAIEVHLYIAYPLLYAISRRYGPKAVLGFTLAVALLYIGINEVLGIERHLPYRTLQGPVFLPYWFVWAMGFYLAEVEAGRDKGFSGRTWAVLMIVGALIGLPTVLHSARAEYADLAWALFFAGLVRWSLGPRGAWFWNLAGLRSLAAVGVVSYSLYAIHVPILHLLHSFFAGSSEDKYDTIWPTLGAIVVALGAAWVFFQLVERWSIRPARNFQMKGRLHV